VAVIGEDLWRTQYGLDPNIVGARLLVNRQPVTIVVRSVAFASAPPIVRGGNW